MSENKGRRAVKQVVVDPAQCVGCLSCMTTCAMAHTGRFSLSASRLEIERHDTRSEHIPRICRQCEEAPCREACPVEAIRENENGVLVVDEASCIACGACVEACPDKGIRLTKLPNGTEAAVKCDQCGGDPWCARFCVVGALRFEERGDGQ